MREWNPLAVVSAALLSGIGWSCPNGGTNGGGTTALSPASATVGVGRTVHLTAIVPPSASARADRWKSSDPTVATVTTSGLVTGVAAGAATITATVGGTRGATAVTVTAASGGDATLVGAGDIAGCSVSGDEATARLLDGIPGTVYTLGDNAYRDGTAVQYAFCYGSGWGRHRARTRPAPGNHEYRTDAAAGGYFGYFGAAAGDPARGYYSYDLGAWHVVVLNSNSGCTTVSCAAGSPQEQWLRADLAAHPARCTLAYWHHPRFNSGAEHGNTVAVAPFWDALYAAGADVVLSGHEHVYERFAPQTPAAAADPARGIRQFTVGTGGKSHYPFAARQPNSEVREANTHGVLKLTLRAEGYDWQFVPVAGATFTDAGSGTCH